MKNVLIIIDTFKPDMTSGAKLIDDLSSGLIKKNKVLIICPRDKNIPNLKKKNFELLNVNCGPIKSNNFIIRGFFELIMSFILWHIAKKKIQNFKPNYLICYSPSIFYNYLCNKIISKYKCKSYLILRDIFPYWTFDIKKFNNFILKFLLINYFNNFSNNFSRIGLEAKKNITFLKKKGVVKKLEFLPNWINLSNFQKNKKLKKNYFQFVFAGNIGIGQDFQKIIKLYDEISKNENLKLNVIGEGSKKDLMKNFNNLKNFKYEKSIPFNSFLKRMKSMNFGIISLREEIQTVNFPGKLLTYLLTNTPILILSKKKNELSEFIEKNKIGVRLGDFKDFNAKLKSLISIQSNIKKNKFYFKKILEKNFSVQKTINKILYK